MQVATKNNFLKFQLLDPLAFEPYASTQFSAGFDLSLPRDTMFPGRGMTIIDYKIAFEIPNSHFGKLETRSSIAKTGLIHLGGVIDSDYRGSIKGIVFNLSDDNIVLKRGRRFGQLVFIPVFHPTLLSVPSLSETQRGAHGLGSTGTSHFSLDKKASEGMDWQ